MRNENPDISREKPPPEQTVENPFPLHALHAGQNIQKLFLRPGLDRIKAGDMTWLEEQHDEKLVRNVLTAYFIEEIWATHRQRISERPEMIGLHPPQESSMAAIREFISICAMSGRSRMIDDYLAAHSRRSLSLSLTHWINNREQWASFDEEHRDGSDHLYAKLKAVIPRNFGVQTFLVRGMNTANSICWDALQVIPSAHRQRFGTEVSAEDFESIALRNSAIMLDLANIHIDTLSNVHNRFNLSVPEAPTSRVVQTMFRLIERNGKLLLALDPKAYQKLPSVDTKEPETGCPALVSKGECKGVIPEMNEWIVDIARAAGVFSHAEKM